MACCVEAFSWANGFPGAEYMRMVVTKMRRTIEGTVNPMRRWTRTGR